MKFKAGARGQRTESTEVGSACAIYLADEGGPELVRTWRLRLKADNWLVGEITTRSPPAVPATAVPGLTPSPRGRMVAMACSPGAQKWVVEVDWANDEIPSPRPGCDVTITCADVPIEPGLRPVNERSRYITGAVAGVVQLAKGQRVEQWAAFSTGAGVTVDVNGYGAIPIPSGGAVRGAPLGALDGAVFTFVGAALGGYLIEWKEC